MKLVIINDQEVRAETIAKEILSLVKEKPNAVLGLATGSSPIKTYQKVIELAKKENIDFSDVTSFNLDEYINNPDFTQSYRYFMDTHLFNFININTYFSHFCCKGFNMFTLCSAQSNRTACKDSGNHKRSCLNSVRYYRMCAAMQIFCACYF